MMNPISSMHSLPTAAAHALRRHASYSLSSTVALEAKIGKFLTSGGARRAFYASHHHRNALRPWVSCHQVDRSRGNGLRMMTSGSGGSNKSVCPSLAPPLLKPAGLLFDYDSISPSSFSDDSSEGELDTCLLPKDEQNLTERVKPPESDFFFIPQVKLHDGDGSQRKRVLVLCTGGTLTMAPNPDKGGALSPVPGALTDFMSSMLELTNDEMPEVSSMVSKQLQKSMLELNQL